MFCKYTVALLILTATVLFHGACAKATQSQTLFQRTALLLEKKCSQNTRNIYYKELLEQLEDLKNCFQVKVDAEGISDEELVGLCHEKSKNSLRCLGAFVEKVEPCLEPKEKYLKQFVVDMHNASLSYFCKHTELLSAAQLLKTNTLKCITTFTNNPEINPHLVCYKNSTIIGDNPTEGTITKEKLCLDMLNIKFCYSDLMDKYCSDAPEMTSVQAGLQTAALEKCTDVLYRGTTETSQDSTEPTEETK